MLFFINPKTKKYSDMPADFSVAAFNLFEIGVKFAAFESLGRFEIWMQREGKRPEHLAVVDKLDKQGFELLVRVYVAGFQCGDKEGERRTKATLRNFLEVDYK